MLEMINNHSTGYFLNQGQAKIIKDQKWFQTCIFKGHFQFAFYVQQFQMKKKESIFHEENRSNIQAFGAQEALDAKQHHFDQYQTSRPFSNETKTLSLVLAMAVRSLFPLSVGITYFLLGRSSTLFVRQINTFILAFKSQFQIIVLICSLFLKIFVAIVIILDSIFYQASGVHKLFQQFIEWLRSYLRMSVQLDFFSSSFILITTNFWTIANFSFSIVIIGFSLIFLENYSSRKDDFYIGSVNFYVLMRLNVFIGSITNVLCLISQSQISMYCFLTVHSMFAIFLTAAYCSQGFIIYRAPVLKWGVFFSVFLYLALVCNMVIDLLIDSNLTTFLIDIFLALLVISLFFYNLIANVKMNIVTERANLKLEKYYLLQILEQSHESEEVQAFVNGTLMMHAFNECSNPLCYTKRQLLYDSKTRLYCSAKDGHTNRASLMKFYIKCKFQLFLDANPDNFDTMVGYSQFLYNHFNNVGLCLYWARQVSQNRSHLGLSEKLKFNGLIRKIRDDNKQFCNIVYGDNLEIENLIEAESVNQSIMSSTFDILQQRIQLERLIQNAEIDLSQIRPKTEKIMEKTEDISQSWKKISNFVNKLKHWKFQYICFAVFLKNEKLSNRILQQFDTTLQNSKEKIFIIQSGSNSIAVDLFDINSCCIHTEIRQGNIFIKKVSRKFTNLTEYSSQEMSNANLTLLMPNIVATKHKEMMIRMSEEGKFSNQNNYFIKQVYIVNKRGLIVPVLKIYKEFVTTEGDLEYVCFLKKINEQQNIILCDQNCQIVGFTEKCSRIITQNSEEEKYIKNFNIISLIPELAGLTKFKELQESKVTDPMQSVRFISCIKGQEHDASQNFTNANQHLGSISYKPSKQYQLIYPETIISELALNYHNLTSNEIDKSDLVRYYKCIKQISTQIKRSQHFTFNCTIELNQIHNAHDMNYFEVKLNRIHPNQPHISSTINPKRHDQAKNFNDLIDPLDLPQAPNKGQFDLANISENTNIFIKDDTNEAPGSNAYINIIKWIWICLFIILITLLILSITLYEKQYNNMGISLDNIYSAGQLSIISSRLVNFYIAKALNFPDINSSLIAELTKEFKDTMNSPSLHQAIFDPTINPPAMYYPNSNNLTGYNHIDLFFFADSSFETLSSTQLKIQSQQYRQLMDYQFPALNSLLNQTKINLDNQFNKYQDKLSTFYNTIFTCQFIILFISAIATAILSYKFYRSMIEMMTIHCQFAQKDVSIIILYHTKIISLFQNMQQYGQADTSDNDLLQKKTLFLTTKQSGIKNQIPQSGNMNKRSKRIIHGKAVNRQRWLYFVKITIYFIILITAVIGRYTYFSSLTTVLDDHEFYGERFLIFVPSRYLAAQIVAHAYQPSVLPQFDPAQYQLILLNLETIVNKPFVRASQESKFQETIRQFYFADACQISVEALQTNNISLDECYQTANHSLKVGLRQFTKYYYNTIKDMLNGQKPSFSDVKAYFRSIDIYHTINNFVINSWAAKYKEMISAITSNIQTYTYLMLMVMVVMLVIFMQVYSYLRKEYRFYRYFYASMMPEYIVSREKIIRSNLAEINFL